MTRRRNEERSVSDRNRVAQIPDRKDYSDLAYLEGEFSKVFLYEGNVSLHLSFHKFSSEWNRYIELDETVN